MFVSRICKDSEPRPRSGLFRFGAEVIGGPPHVVRCARCRGGGSERHAPVSMPAGFRPVPGVSASRWTVTNARRVSCELSGFDCLMSFDSPCGGLWPHGCNQQNTGSSHGSEWGRGSHNQRLIFRVRAKGRALEGLARIPQCKGAGKTAEILRKSVKKKFRTKLADPEI
jgi:hypothetical protein